MLALDNDTCISQLYATEYRPGFESPTKPWSQHRPWADFRLAEPLDLDGRYLTLECYHVGWGQSDSWEWATVKDRWLVSDETLRGKGVRSGMLHEVMEWLDMQDKIGGLLTWGLEPDYELLVWAGQNSHTAYEWAGFREIKRVVDPIWAQWYGEKDRRSLRHVMVVDRQ